jgi:hypothetical protein
MYNIFSVTTSHSLSGDCKDSSAIKLIKRVMSRVVSISAALTHIAARHAHPFSRADCQNPRKLENTDQTVH